MTIDRNPFKSTLVVATSNLGKLAEIRSLLEEHPIRLVRPIDILSHPIEVVEDGLTFQDNAEKKARAVGVATGEVTLADDSGLEVDAIGGLPGVRSARFAGVGASDEQNNIELMRQLADCSSSLITARFRCAIALFDPNRDVVDIVSGSCEGTIIRTPRGTAGFGYDPHFAVTEMANRTMAELSAAEKNLISHRGKALRAMLPRLLAALPNGR
jgi:XTP/dITP diphosphohydrolase